MKLCIGILIVLYLALTAKAQSMTIIMNLFKLNCFIDKYLKCQLINQSSSAISFINVSTVISQFIIIFINF